MNLTQNQSLQIATKFNVSKEEVFNLFNQGNIERTQFFQMAQRRSMTSWERFLQKITIASSHSNNIKPILNTAWLLD
jgi:hypothetical protein